MNTATRKAGSGSILETMDRPLTVVCPTCDAAIGAACALPTGIMSADTDYCPERKLKADIEDEQALEQLIYEW